MRIFSKGTKFVSVSPTIAPVTGFSFMPRVLRYTTNCFTAGDT